MIALILNWIWHLEDRDLCALIGLSFVGLSGISYFVGIPARLSGSLDNIADAIRERK